MKTVNSLEKAKKLGELLREHSPVLFKQAYDETIETLEAIEHGNTSLAESVWENENERTPEELKSLQAGYALGELHGYMEAVIREILNKHIKATGEEGDKARQAFKAGFASSKVESEKHDPLLATEERYKDDQLFRLGYETGKLQGKKHPNAPAEALHFDQLTRVPSSPLRRPISQRSNQGVQPQARVAAHL